MILARVEGNVVASQKDAGLEGFKLLLARHVDMSFKPTGAYTIAADAIGAGEGELVLVVTGSSARMAERTLQKPVDAAVVAIVDSVSLGGKVVYDKAGEARSASSSPNGAAPEPQPKEQSKPQAKPQPAADAPSSSLQRRSSSSSGGGGSSKRGKRPGAQ